MKTASLWRALLKNVLETEDDEITCQECFGVLDFYAEMLAQGGNPAVLLPKVKQHLRQCVSCNEQLEAVMVMLREASANG
ncbi:MAG: hypothetical protein D6768_18430 [Chloroflexi bacterium]|nr:MAG: hypothetical protein D6768_18430 [Chloroflexota bacterium]